MAVVREGRVVVSLTVVAMVLGVLSGTIIGLALTAAGLRWWIALLVTAGWAYVATWSLGGV